MDRWIDLHTIQTVRAGQGDRKRERRWGESEQREQRDEREKRECRKKEKEGKESACPIIIDGLRRKH